MNHTGQVKREDEMELPWVDPGKEYDDSPTCFAANSKLGTRKDYILASPTALRHVHSSRVIPDRTKFDTHLPYSGHPH